MSHGHAHSRGRSHQLAGRIATTAPAHLQQCSVHRAYLGCTEAEAIAAALYVPRPRRPKVVSIRRFSWEGGSDVRLIDVEAIKGSAAGADGAEPPLGAERGR